KINKPFLSNLLVGMVSGFLPCGVLYPAYILSFGTGDIFLGALTMGTFFIGTFPGLYLFGIGYNSLKNKISTKFLPVIGVLIIAFGLGSLYMRMGFGHKPHCHDHKTMEHKH
ncbi:MAG: sulfite exporter TauE/SafE family protein, partial [Leptospiraceae bacterium]|nr:sulfite exporter TauE/SafE family protein [Leptospiraceae bacterium]